MKRFFLLIAFLAAATSVVTAFSVSAQSVPMTEDQIARIRSNCVEAQSTLRQVHASDALLRVNRGQVYESLATKLMAPLNSRIALEKADGLGLNGLTANYERQLNEFRANYKSYEEAMSSVLRLNCVNQPVAFYDAVSDARAKRRKVSESTQALQQTIQMYRQEFEAFKQRFLEKTQ